MTNTQQIIKLDLSSLLTETSTYSDNKYTSSALELLLNEEMDQLGAGLGSMLAGFGKKAVALGKRAASPERIKQAVGSMTDRGRQLATSVDTAVRNSPERLRKAVGNISPRLDQMKDSVRNAVGNISPRLTQMKDSVRNAVSPPRTKSTSPNSPRPQNYTQGQQPANMGIRPNAQYGSLQDYEQEQQPADTQGNTQEPLTSDPSGRLARIEEGVAANGVGLQQIKEILQKLFNT